MLNDVNPLVGELQNVESLMGELNRQIEYITPTTQEKTITPNKEQQIVEPDDGVFALSKVVVETIPEKYIEVNGTIDITSNGEYDVKEFEKANVNVSTSSGGEDNLEITSAEYLFYMDARIDIMDKLLPKISSKCSRFQSMFCYCQSKLLEVPYFDTSNASYMSSMFEYATLITNIPLLNTSNVINMKKMFSQCTNLLEVPLLDTSNVTNMSYMFQNCSKLKSIPQFNTSKNEDFSYMFQRCTELLEIPLLDFGKAKNISNILSNCSKVTTLVGFKDLGKAFTQKSNNYSSYTLTLSSLNDLTHDSLMNVINNLYDLNLTYGVANGGTLYTQKLVLGATNLAKLTEEEINIAVEKGWSVS